MKDASALNADHQEARHQIISMETGLLLQFKKLCKTFEEIASSFTFILNVTVGIVYIFKRLTLTYFKQIISAAASGKAVTSLKRLRFPKY